MPQPRRRRHGTPARPPARARTARRFPGGLHRGADARDAEMQASATDVLRNLIALNQAR